METSTLLYVVLIITFLILLRRVLRRKVINLKQKKVLITGAASGIGRMLAGDMAKKVCELEGFDE